MNVRKPTYFVKRVAPGEYRIVMTGRVVLVRKAGRYWFSNGNYFVTLRDAIIGALA